MSDPLGDLLAPYYNSNVSQASFDTAVRTKVGPQNSLDSLGSTGLMMGIVGAIGGAATGYYTSRLNKIQNKWAAVIAEENAKMSELQAQDALRASQVRTGEISRKAQRVKSGQKVAMAANGIAMTGGTYAEVLTSTDIYKEESIREETLRGYREAWGYRMQGLSYEGQASAYASSAKSSNPLASAGAGLFSGGMNAAYNYAKFKQWSNM